ncbi:MAG: bifunctional heptose 7-phosphate kinase/heptose 1-phosphate adenyltransferase [Candidatus Obscuribacterales bacterium]
MTSSHGPGQDKQGDADSGRTPEARDVQGKASDSAQSVSFNELLKDSQTRNPEKGEKSAAGQADFDARRTTDISKLLSGGNVARDLTAQPVAGRDFTWSTTRLLDASANMGLTIPLGLRQHFRLRGVEKKEEDDSFKFKNLKNDTDDFLKNIKLEDDSRLSDAERRDLQDTLEALRNVRNEDDLLSNSLHLARLLQHLRYIEEARRAARLAMATDPKSVLANQLFKELERVHPSDIAISPITARAQLTKSNLARRIIDLGKGNVIVVGDLLIDELLEGRPERISREAPVLILEHVETNLIPGGAANTANNITALGGACHAIGVCGVDEYAGKLAAMLEKHGITHDLVADPTRPTTVKTRILSKSHSLMQQLLRLDRIAHRNIDSSVERELGLKVAAAASRFQAIILSDYRAGAITNSIIESCRKIASETRTLLIVDAQNGFERFGGCSLITPNQPDTEAALGYKIDSPLTLSRAGDEMLRLSGAEAILITRGSEGMALFQKNQPMEELPPFNRSEVFDVTGAGDTVVATMALALVTGSSYVEAMALGNLAAGIVVKKSGTAVTSQKEMLDTLETLDI